MSRKTNRTTGTLAAVLMAATLAPSASLAYRDVRSPDASDAAEASTMTQRQDLRTQDALDAARSLPPDQLVAVSEGLRSTSQELRSQDALDAARSLPPHQLIAVSEGLRSTSQDLRSRDTRNVARNPNPEATIVRVNESEGFDWPSAVIGAASLLGLIGASLAVLLGVRQIRRRPAQP